MAARESVTVPGLPGVAVLQVKSASFVLPAGFQLVWMTLGEIALAFQRDRSTAAYAIRRIEEAREQPMFDRQISIIEAALRWHGGVHG